MKNVFVSCVLAFTVALASLAAAPQAQAATSSDEAFYKEVTSEAQGLVQDLNDRATVTRPLLVMSSQSLDDLEKSQSVGRLIGELVSSSLSKSGYAVYEVRLGQRVRVGEEGEHILSRDFQKLQGQYSADYIIVGTHTKTFSKVYVTLKAVRLSDGLVIASRSFIARSPRIF